MTGPNPVVVGVDGTPGSELALRWAVDDADTRGVPLRIITAYRWALTDPWALHYDLRDPERERLRHKAEHRLVDATRHAADLRPGVHVECQAVDGVAGQVLISQSEHACVIVIGSRQLKALGSAMLGSVSAAVAGRSHCPVVVVRGPAGDPAERAAVIVAVDGTEASEALLAVGFEHASRHRVPLRAVLCWRPDLLASMSWRSEPPPPERAERWLAEATAGWREKYPEVQATQAVTRAHPVDGLMAESAAQFLLVVGTHSRHALAGTLLGSVAQGALHHASCPVMVVPNHR